MKRITTNSNKAIIFASLLLVFFAGSDILAQGNNISFGDRVIENLRTGITSDNYGLKRSSLYFAGKYKVEEILPVIIEELKTSKDNRIKILAARVLYEIGNKNGIYAVKEVALTDTTNQVKRICAAIYNTYTAESGKKYYAKNN